MVKSSRHPLASSVRRIAQMLISSPSLTPTPLAPSIAAIETPRAVPTLLSPAIQAVEAPLIDGTRSPERKE
jgi:hypothetical protein